ncbi:MAG: hypothetical protein ACLP1Y_07425 [Candidatus Acidiferrales bacterium]
MYAPQSFAAALVLMVLCTICWGTWANPYKSTRGGISRKGLIVCVVSGLLMGRGLREPATARKRISR